MADRGGRAHGGGDDVFVGGTASTTEFKHIPLHKHLLTTRKGSLDHSLASAISRGEIAFQVFRVPDPEKTPMIYTSRYFFFISLLHRLPQGFYKHSLSFPCVSLVYLYPLF